MYFSAFQEQRANRGDYFLGSLVCLLVAIISFALLGGGGAFPFIGFIIALFNVCVSLALSVNRLQDLDHSGWFTLVLFIPFIGFLFAIYLLFAKGTDGENKYGQQRK